MRSTQYIELTKKKHKYKKYIYIFIKFSFPIKKNTNIKNIDLRDKTIYFYRYNILTLLSYFLKIYF